ncbi:3-isopropylmalate dehydrogenase [Natronorubrum sediminis]|uniref:3-isopropylmalate dehydrogenase n=1 Tax=Natronorubrum sediminis TaxID=640943 RepID=A0A1H6G759_9EURY|nr:isocitrate/isopropylmalate family dehydrogenase [Natronorubrum sediminis]SEH17824.1 3-isopropylmalate dehydrogenase [Natronorubrum sediminis]
MTTSVCVFEGDGAAPEAVAPTVELLESLVPEIRFETPSVEQFANVLDRGDIPDPLRERIDDADAVFFGAASDRHVPILRYLRYELDGGLPANARPVRSLEGAASPLEHTDEINYVVVRQNLEGLYAGIEGNIADLDGLVPPADSHGLDRDVSMTDGRYALRPITAVQVRWLARFACDLAERRSNEDTVPQLTCATKSNVLPETDGLFERTVESVAADSSTQYEHVHADAVGELLVTDPERFDVLVAPNLAGDLLSDVAAGTVGGLGLAPSGCYGPESAYFEPVHGTAPDLRGESSINPTATLLSAVMLLEYLERESAAKALQNAIERVYLEGVALTPDQGGSSTTDELIAAVAARL